MSGRRVPPLVEPSYAISRPIASFSAWARACSVPRYRSLGWIEA